MYPKISGNHAPQMKNCKTIIRNNFSRINPPEPSEPVAMCLSAALVVIKSKECKRLLFHSVARTYATTQAGAPQIFSNPPELRPSSLPNLP